MDFTTLTIKVLKMLSLFGGYGVGIILLTVLVRAAMWPLGLSQQRSMRTMQMLQPKMKAIQERYKSSFKFFFSLLSCLHVNFLHNPTFLFLQEALQGLSKSTVKVSFF